MTYRITGLPPEPFAPLFALSDEALMLQGARRVIATGKPGYPCRVTLEDAEPGESLILVNHASHDVATPFRSAYAIFVREGATAAATFVDQAPPVFTSRALSLRAVDATGMVRDALLIEPGGADAAIRKLFEVNETAYILAFNAMAGCFSARVERA